MARRKNCDAGRPSAAGSGQVRVRVRVRVASVGGMDRLTTRGRRQFRPPLPCLPGADAAGENEAPGEGAEGLEPGGRVCCSGWRGALAERTMIDAHRMATLPDAVENGVASMILRNGLAARPALADRAALQPGTAMSVTGAAGGVGMARSTPAAR